MVRLCLVRISETVIFRQAKYLKSSSMSSLADSEKRMSIASTVNRRDL